jgi:hypothetical protein
VQLKYYQKSLIECRKIEINFFLVKKKIKMANPKETNHTKKIDLQIVKTTGGSFQVTVDSDITVENLKKIVSKKLKISKDRICLMNSER